MYSETNQSDLRAQIAEASSEDSDVDSDVEKPC